MPQLLLAPSIATILRFVEPRITMAFDFTLVGCACFMAGQFSDNWASDDFLPSQILQVVDQTFALTSLAWFSLNHLRPAEILTYGALLLQSGRRFGSQLGTAFIQTFIRVHEHLYSNLVGLHVVSGATSTDARLQGYAGAVLGRSIGDPEAHERGTSLLASAIRKQSYVLAYIDGFMILGFAAIAALLLM